VLTEERGTVLVITLNRPEVRNAVNRAVAEGLAAAIDHLDTQEHLRVGVLTGAGGTFSSGMDLRAFGAGESPTLPGRGFAGLVASPPRRPLIAAVEGFALAGGFEIALACDLVVASRTAQFGLPEVTRGLTAAAGGLLRLPLRLPFHVALELAMTGRRIDGDEAARLALINRITEPGQALAEALRLAEVIAQNAPLAVIASKEVMMRARDWTTEEQFARQEEVVAPIRISEDAQEGARAFLERRPPLWHGR